MNFWQTKEWAELKIPQLQTVRLLSRVEYLRLVGYENYSEEKYLEYLKIMTNGNNQKISEEIKEGA